MAEEDITLNEKRHLRTHVRELLNNVPPHQIETISATVCSHIAGSGNLFKNVKTIAVFSAHGKEVDLSSLHLLTPNIQLAYPLCHAERQLSFHIVASPDTMTPGTWGILEPVPDRHPVVHIEEIDLFLCPGLAFGQDGTRLGHGGGYYDRALTKKSPTAEAWGIGMDIQMLDRIACDAHDQLMNGVITESGIIPATPD